MILQPRRAPGAQLPLLGPGLANQGAAVQTSPVLGAKHLAGPGQCHLLCGAYHFITEQGLPRGAKVIPGKPQMPPAITPGWSSPGPSARLPATGWVCIGPNPTQDGQHLIHIPPDFVSHPPVRRTWEQGVCFGSHGQRTAGLGLGSRF